MPSKIYPWKRYWVPKGEAPSMDSGLFVEPSDLLRWFGPASNGKSLIELKDTPCLVLLGDVGMGKSVTTKMEAEELQTSLKGQNHEVVYEDLKRLNETLLERRVFQNPLIDGWARSEHALTLFLDSLDECWRRIDFLEILLRDGFEKRLRKGLHPLYLRVTCRSAEWRGDLGEKLKCLFPPEDEKDSVQILVLAPLSSTNVQEAANAENLDGNALLTKIKAKEAQTLASHPITLKMLLEIYKTKGDFPASRVDLYEQGCLRLCSDENVIPQKTLQRKTTPEQRLLIAGRLADREVQIRRRIGEDRAQLIDILVRAVPIDENGQRAVPVSVVIEVKGVWNDGVMEDIQVQLFDRYLKSNEMNFGVYVTRRLLYVRRVELGQ